MHSGNVAEVTSLHSAIYIKFGRSPEKVTAYNSLDYMIYDLHFDYMKNGGAVSF